MPGSESEAHALLHELGAAARINWVTTKRDYRVRAHSNPLSDGIGYDAPISPAIFQKSLPSLLGRPDDDPEGCHVSWCDVGCGYGGLLASLSVAFPECNMIGLEIRERVAEFCEMRLKELRREYSASSTSRPAPYTSRPAPYTNLGFVRTNAMRFMPNYFTKASLKKLFFCFPGSYCAMLLSGGRERSWGEGDGTDFHPYLSLLAIDPHFKKRRHRQRVISDQLLAEYAYVLAPGGVAYIVTDVPELFDWMNDRLSRFPLFRRRTAEEVAADPIVAFVRDMTDEAARVDKSDRGKQDSSFVRL
jgi:tRNA (guanine-N7-)-methyltransferase